MGPYQILTSVNGPLAVTNLVALGSPTPGGQTYSNPPLGTVNGSATGELGMKVVLAGSTSVSGGGIPVVSTPQTVTLNTALLGASVSQTIPTGAKGYFFAILTGTATVNGTPSVPAGVSLGDPNTVAAGFAIATDAGSSAFMAWNT